MAVARMYPNGMTMGIPGPGLPPDTEVRRGDVKGWTAGAVRRHTRWLYSVDFEALDAAGVGWALTLTLRDTPENAKDWQALRRRWVAGLTRRGMVLLHWVVEWQERGTPHLHCAVYFDRAIAGTRDMGREAVDLWLDLARKYRPTIQGQDWDRIRSAGQWNRYLSKHSARGVRHYQRSGSPEGWEKTGRLWGHSGDWPVVDASDTILDRRTEFARLRRLVRSWRIADARQALQAARTPSEARQARRRIARARRMLKCNDRALSTVRGCSEWVPFETSSRWLALF